MIWTRQEMHHSTGNVPSCPAHLGFDSRTFVLGCVHQERRMDQDLSRYKCLPPFIVNHKACDHLLCKQEALASQVGTKICSHVTERGSPGASAPLSTEGPTDQPGRTRIHWSCTRVWWWAWRSEAAVPGSAEPRQATEVTRCESGRVCWSAVLPWHDTSPIQPEQCHQGGHVRPPPACVGAGSCKVPLCRSLGLYCLSHKYHGQVNFCFNV